MQTQLLEKYLETRWGKEAESILRKCVHCGFCTATCPTYQLLGDELDGPRGRIYQIKQVLEGKSDGRSARKHLDRCLTCRSCETTCPSGVEYGRLLDAGRKLVEKAGPRPVWQRIQRTGLALLLSSPGRARFLFGFARVFRVFLPSRLARKIPDQQQSLKIPDHNLSRKMLVLEGCVQPVLTPRTNQAARIVLGRLGISLKSVKTAGCCGALNQHLSRPEQALQQLRNNIDAWWPEIEGGAEAIISTATGCGVMLKEYAHLLADDPDYAEKAARITALVRDVSEVVTDHFDPDCFPRLTGRVAFHAPCTYQHGLRLSGKVESVLQSVGLQLCPVADAHLCCGSAGTYSVLQPDLSSRLLDNKLVRLGENDPQMIVTANVGCQTHLASGSEIPVKHWLELLASN